MSALYLFQQLWIPLSSTIYSIDVFSNLKQFEWRTQLNLLYDLRSKPLLSGSSPETIMMRICFCDAENDPLKTH